ncbi:hypothetical protein Hanom_Chr05g00445111 [Helianthus anomalus]
MPLKHHYYLSKLQVFSFMFTSNCRRCSFTQKFTGGVLNLSKSCTFCPLGQTWLKISVKNCHVRKMVISLTFTLSLLLQCFKPTI